MERVGAIVAAAGSSRRMDGVDKLCVPLGDKPLLAWSVDVLDGSPLVSEIVIAVHPARVREVESLGRERRWRKTRVVPGGERRQDSVAGALSLLGDVEWVMVHDGDRPFLDEALIVDGLKAARDMGVAIAGVPVKDTVKSVSPQGIVETTLDRDVLRFVQTPQVFRADIIRHAYSRASEAATDDAVLAERLGYTVRVYDGSYDNLKVTTPEDLVAARAIAERRGGRA